MTITLPFLRTDRIVVPCQIMSLMARHVGIGCGCATDSAGCRVDPIIAPRNKSRNKQATTGKGVPMASEFPNEPNGVPPHSPIPPCAPAPAGGGMIGRIQRLLMRPKEEWARIDPEPPTAMQMFMS